MRAMRQRDPPPLLPRLTPLWTILSNIHEGGHVGSRNRKRGWIKYCRQPGVNLLHALWATAGHEIESEAGQSIASTWGHPSSRALPGHGGSRDRKRGWTVERWQSILSFDLGNCSD